MRHETIFLFHNLSTYEKILGFAIYSEELQRILYRHIFAHVLWIKITEIRACCQLWRTLIALLKDEQVIKMLEKMCQIRWQRKSTENMLQIASTRKKRARMHVCMIFLQMLNMALNVCKKKLGRLEHFKFLRAGKRADERARVNLCTFIDLKLTGRILILIMIIMNEK